MTVLPYVADVIWRHMPPVMMESDPWAISRHLAPYSNEQRDIVNLGNVPWFMDRISHRWLHVAQVVRNVVCPLEGWRDILHARYYWVGGPSAAPFESAMQTNSPWWVHGVATLVLLGGAGILFGWSAWLLRRLRGG